MFELTPEQSKEVRGDEPARAVDPQTKETYVLVRTAVYERMKDLLEDVDPESMYPLLAQISPEDWEDPSVYGITRS